MLIAAWLGCTGDAPPRPELAAAAGALARWRAGEAALAAGDAATARAAFAEARALRPDPVLAAWEGRAAEAAGDGAAASALYREALAGDPGLAAARWSLALGLARAGRPEDAARELQRALADGAGTAVDVRLDPEWGPFLGDPAFGFVPAAPVSVAVSPMADTTYWGSELRVRLRVSGRLGDTVTVAADASGPVALQSVAEEVTAAGREVELAWRVTGAGAVRLGPFAVTTAGATVAAEPVSSTASAPPGKTAPPPAPAWPVLSGDALSGGVERVGDTVYAPVPYGATVTADGDVPQLRLTSRVGDEVRSWVGLAGLPPGAALRIGREAPVRAP